jgi:hypothetical protein
LNLISGTSEHVQTRSDRVNGGYNKTQWPYSQHLIFFVTL